MRTTKNPLSIVSRLLCRQPVFRTQNGFTLIELVMVIIILGILSAAVAIRWPTGMQDTAAVLEFKHAVRYAQHMAMTRQFTLASAAWGINVAGNQYTVQRADNTQFADPEFRNRTLMGNATIVGGPVWFNGLGEPINTATGAPLAVNTIFTIGGTGTVTVLAETGYVQ